jgi:hypothetical protein
MQLFRVYLFKRGSLNDTVYSSDCTPSKSFSVVKWLSCLPLNPRFAGSNPTEGDGFLRAIKIRSTTAFGGEVKPSAPCCKILRHVKDPCGV